jgi:nucleoside-diphosphate-sugar epimerase
MNDINQKMTILLIGGTGVISSEIMNLCIILGYKVFVLNRGKRANVFNDKALHIEADIRYTGLVIEKTKGMHFDVVIDFLSFNQRQLNDTFNIFQSKCNQYIFISSVAVYNRTKSLSPINEEDSPIGNPVWDYSVDKVSCENHLIYESHKYSINYTIVRPGIIYGNTRIPYGMMPAYGWHWTFVARMLRGKPIVKWDGGETICNITHTIDFARGVAGLLCNSEAFNQSFNIVSDNQYTWNEIISVVAEILGCDIVSVDIPTDFICNHMPELKGIIMGDRAIDAIYDNRKIKRIAPEFRSSIKLKDGIMQTIEYYKNNNYIYGIDYKWDAEIDKLITNYAKQNKSIENFSVHFTDYLDNASKVNKYTYYKHRYSPRLILRMISMIERILKYMIKKIM